MSAVGFNMGSKSTFERVVRKNEPIIFHLDQAGAEVFYTNEGVSYSDGSFEVANQIFKNGTQYRTKPVHQVALDSIRDLTGRLDVNVPTINEPEVIANARDKAVFYNHFQELSAKSAVFRADAPNTLADALDEFSGHKRLVLKPKTGNESKGVVILDKEDVAGLAAILPSGSEWIIQEELKNNTLQYLKDSAADEDSRYKIAASKQAELRLFTSTLSDGYPALKVWLPNTEISNYEYSAIDPDKVPESAYKLAKYCVDKLVRISGNPKMLLAAVDIWHTGNDNSFDGWQVIEANVKEPGLPPDKNSRRHIGKLIANELLKV